MVFILAASSLSHVVKVLSKNQEKRLEEKVLAIPGASAHPRARDCNKTLQRFLDPKKGLYRKRSDKVVWHDLVNNSFPNIETTTIVPLKKLS